jgi:hypothetical protein
MSFVETVLKKGLQLGPHDPERHDHKEPDGAGLAWWGKEVARIIVLSELHGELLNQLEAADFLDVTKQVVSRLGSREVIRCFRAGRHNFYPLSDLKAYKKRRDGGEVEVGRGRKAQPVYAT